VEILLWLVPPMAVTLVAMAWVGWVGRAGRGQVSGDEALRRMGEALDREPAVSHTVVRAPREPSTGVAVRRRAEPVAAEEPDVVEQDEEQPDQQRRAS
jgi:hypothetical protein